MNKISLIFFTSLFVSTIVNAQSKVANYACGKPGTDTYEHLSFWVKDGKRHDITYVYGKDRKEVHLRYVAQMGGSGFTVQFPNNTVLKIVPVGATLNVRNAKANYAKIFKWEYEGPVNGIGTFCTVCAQDEKDAMKLMKSHYLR